MAKSHHGRATATVMERLQSRKARLAAFLALFAIVAIFGGGSRGDVASLVVLRPLAVLFGGYALLVAPAGQWRDFRALLFLLAAAFVAVGWQLVPLPPSLWQQLPYRDTIVQIDRTLGVADIWRPAALSPSGAWNALCALFVPAAALFGYIALDPRDRPKLLPAIAVFALASALIGLMQLLSDPTGALYFYNITNAGLPVGLFSNRNHHAILLAAAMPILALWASTMQNRAGWVMPVCLAGEVMLLLVALLTGSRAGLLGAAIALVATVWVIAGRSGVGKGVSQAAPSPWRRRPVLIGAAVGGFAVVIALILMFDRGLALERFLATDPETEVRVQAFPVVVDMLRESWLLGVGPGSFPGAFEMLEPTAMLGPNYLNHAHNDWLELPVELGVPGVLVLLGFLTLAAGYAMRLLRSPVRLGWGTRFAVLAPPAILAAASIVDYPLRTPSLAMVALLWLAAMGDVSARILAPPSRRRS